MPIMSPFLRKVGLMAHITSSLGWVGAVAGFLALSMAGLTSRNAETVRAAYLAMNIVGLFVIVPLSLASLFTGVIQSIGTQWGLSRYYWVLTKLVLTVFAVVALLLHQFTAVAEAAKRVSGTTSGLMPEIGKVGVQLAAISAIALVVLLVVTALGIFKPWGKTTFGRSGRQSPGPAGPASISGGLPVGLRVFLAVIGLLVAVFIIVHLSGGGLGMHHR
jgi:hypothetical protein